MVAREGRQGKRDINVVLTNLEEQKDWEEKEDAEI